MPTKFLIALQYYHGDVVLVNKLIDLVVDLEGGHSDRADFLLVSRYDHTPDPKLAMKLSRKFNVKTHRCRRQATGWPHGCNEMWFDTMTLAYEQIKAAKWPKYDGILTLEADDCPLSRNWVNLIGDEWNRRPGGSVCMGDVVSHPGEHMNGNAMFSTDLKFLGEIRKLGAAPVTQGWDYWLSAKFRKWGWYDSPIIESWWKTPTATKHALTEARGRGCVLLHGVKDASAINIIRNNPADFP